MNEKHAKQSAADNGMMKIWLMTGLAVVLILGVAVFFSMKARMQTQARTQEPALVDKDGGVERPVLTETTNSESAPVAEMSAPAPAAAPQVQEQVQEQAQEQAPAPLAPTLAIIDTRPALQLDHLAGTLSVDSRAILTDDRLDMSHSCYRMGQSMPVSWAGVPAGTQSLVLVLEERVAGEPPFVKWLAYNLPPQGTGIAAAVRAGNDIPGGGLQGRNDHHVQNYTGPCIPRGVVPYSLRLFALDTVLPVEAGIEFANLIPQMNGHIIDMAERTFKFYNRK